ncbi:MAG TPA: HAD-IA family hydrolase [Gaiellaceae bacterium]|nr:HAD-IA family hydrolase [Gaiellaceae bacterium]
MDAVIFDLWDTLVPLPSAVREEAIAQMSHALGLSLSAFRAEWSAAWLARATGPLEPVVRDISTRLAGSPPDDDLIEQVLRIRHEVHAAAFVPRVDARETLAACRQAGVRIGVLTNCSAGTPELWQGSALAELVDAVAFSVVEHMMKPHPDFYRLLLRRLDAEPGACLYVGDGSDGELDGAVALGFRAVLYDSGNDSLDAWTGPRVHSLKDTLPLLHI